MKAFRREEVVRAYGKAMRRKDWYALRARPWKERFLHYPFRTIWCALLDRFWFAVIRITGNPLVTTKTFWGQPIMVRFDENRPIVHDGLIDSKELALTAFFVKNLTPRDTFFDVGANVGFYTLLGGALGAQVVAFEPMPQTVAILRKNAPNATIVASALMDKSGTLLFADYGIGAGLNKALIGEEAEHTIRVEATTLDAYCSEHSVFPTVMKIDAENAESYVIQGGRRIIQERHPVLVVEGNERIIEALGNLGYSAFQLKDNGEPVPYLAGDIIFNDNLLFKIPLGKLGT